jgi:hypothetical protein
MVPAPTHGNAKPQTHACILAACSPAVHVAYAWHSMASQAGASTGLATAGPQPGGLTLSECCLQLADSKSSARVRSNEGLIHSCMRTQVTLTHHCCSCQPQHPGTLQGSPLAPPAAPLLLLLLLLLLTTAPFIPPPVRVPFHTPHCSVHSRARVVHQTSGKTCSKSPPTPAQACDPSPPCVPLRHIEGTGDMLNAPHNTHTQAPHPRLGCTRLHEPPT